MRLADRSGDPAKQRARRKAPGAEKNTAHSLQSFQGSLPLPPDDLASGTFELPEACRTRTCKWSKHAAVCIPTRRLASDEGTRPFRFYRIGHQRSYALACHYRPVRGPRGDLFGVRLEAPPQGLRKARAWQRVAARPTRLDLKEAFEYASRSFLNAVVLCCDLRCKIKQN